MQGLEFASQASQAGVKVYIHVQPIRISSPIQTSLATNCLFSRQVIHSQVARGLISRACRHCVRTSSQSSSGFYEQDLQSAPVSADFEANLTEELVGTCRPPNSTNRAVSKPPPVAPTPSVIDRVTQDHHTNILTYSNSTI